jgi:hypothetical protein
MQTRRWLASLTLCLLGTLPANAQVIGGVMSVTGAEMH